MRRGQSTHAAAATERDRRAAQTQSSPGRFGFPVWHLADDDAGSEEKKAQDLEAPRQGDGPAADAALFLTIVAALVGAESAAATGATPARGAAAQLHAPDGVKAAFELDEAALQLGPAAAAVAADAGR